MPNRYPSSTDAAATLHFHMSSAKEDRTPHSRGAAGANTHNAEIRFEIEPDNLNLTDQQLIADLQRVARRLKTDAMTMRAYSRFGRVAALTISRRFHGWNPALVAANLKPVKRSRITPDQITEDLQRVALKISSRTFTRAQYLIHGRFGGSVVTRTFKTWNNALQVAGLDCGRTSSITPTQDLFDNLEELWLKLGRQPLSTEIRKPHSRFNLKTYTNRFGSVRKALRAFVQHKKTTGQLGGNPMPNPPTFTPPMIHKTPRTPNWRLRYQILQRDDFRCRACGRSPANDPGTKLHADHIHPWSRGGETVEKNLQTLCDRCNGGKSDSMD